MEYVEIRAKTVDLAVEAAMVELGVDDPEELAVEIISEPVKGFLGLGGEDAVVRVKRQEKTRQRRGRGAKRPDNRRRRGDQRDQNEKPQQRQRQRQDKPRGGEKKKQEKRPEKKALEDDRPQLGLEDQAKIAREFLEGLLDAYGLEGEVTASVDDDLVVANVKGEQTEALVGDRGSVRSAIHELTRTVIQRDTRDSARLRLDIAGYGERRRQALSIYADQLIDQLLEEGGEIMLEPMSPADRKVIHDAAAARGGVTSYSEGEPPRRYVVLSVSDSEGGSEEE
ncbi:MAG: Jag N-terminal domain-containing protein [Actinobacteria bacterium]|nr:Jag N-terminal domain-containing protein [Actinomycetota bacterium]